MDMKMVMMLRLIKKPITPRENSTALKIRYQERGTISALPLSEHDRAHDGNQNENRSDLKRQQKFLEQQSRDGFGFAKVLFADSDATERLVLVDHDPADYTGERDDSRNPHQQSNAAASRAFLSAGVQQHDDEHEQHHDGPGVDDHLDGGDELRAQQQVDQGQG